MPQRLPGLSSRAIIGKFYETLAGEFDKSWPAKIGMRFDSDQESETYKWLGMIPGVRELQGQKLVKGLRENGLTIANKIYELTLGISVDDLRRDKTGQIMVRVQEMADRFNQHWAKLLTTLIENGDGSTNGNAYDGQYFFDTDHSTGDSGTQKNLLTASEVPALDVATASNPTQAEMALAVLGVISYMLGIKDDQGEPVNAEARSFLVYTPVNLYGAAVQAASQANLLAANGTAIPNPIAGAGFKLDVACNPRSTWTDKFCVFRTDGRTKPFILQEEKKVQMSVLGEGSDHEFKNREHLYSGEAIRNVGYGMWEQAARATLS